MVVNPGAERAAAQSEADARMCLRRAVSADVDSIWNLKRRLHITPVGGATAEGGFLLGVPRARYVALVEHANVVVLERGAVLVGFAVTLPDHVLRATDVWARRAGIEWLGTRPAVSDDARVGYFDQLACLPGWSGRLGAPALALRALLDLVETGHQHVFATVVRQPFHNVAALRMLEAVGARRAGRLVAQHAAVGRLVSDVYHLDLCIPEAPRPWDATALGRRIRRIIDQWSATHGTRPMESPSRRTE